MKCILLSVLAGLAAAGDEHLSLLQTTMSKVQQHSSDVTTPSACKAARAELKAARKDVKDARAALKAARAALKLARKTFQTKKTAKEAACPEKEKKPKPAKPCASKGFEESDGYASSPGYKRYELIAGPEAGKIGTLVYNSPEWKAKTEGERQEGYHKMMCEAIKPEFCGGKPCKDIRGAHVDPTCEKATAPKNHCDPRGRAGARCDVSECWFAEFNPAAHYAFCMDPICAQLCADDPNCQSYEVKPAHRGCELQSQTGPDKMPYYGAETNNYGVPQDYIFCVKK